MGVANDFTDPERTALKGVEAIEQFYRQIGMPTCISELMGKTATEEEIEHMAKMCSRGYSITIGSLEILGPEEMKTVYRMANR